MKTSDLRAKDVAALEKEVADLLQRPFRPAHAEGDPAADEPLHAAQDPP